MGAVENLENSLIHVGRAAESMTDFSDLSIYVDGGIFRHPHVMLQCHAYLL
jgi:hypothetical protein